MALFSFFNRSQIEASQSQKEVTANTILEALAKSAGVFSKTVTTTTNLSQSESEHGVILLTGNPGGAATVTQDAATTKPTIYQNLTSGGFTIQVKIGAGGTLFTVPLNSLLLLLSTTDAVIFGSDTAPLAHAMTAAAGTSEQLSRVDHRHPRDIVEIAFNLETVTWTDQPAALTEFLGLNDRRARYDLTQFTEARLITNVEAIGAAGATLRAEFATTDGGAYAALDNTTGPNVSLATAGTIVSAYVSLTAAAKADVFLRVSGVGGDAVADPQIGALRLQFR